jgi:hypothetical protein
MLTLLANPLSVWQVEVLSTIASAGGDRSEASSGDSRKVWTFTYYYYFLGRLYVHSTLMKIVNTNSHIEIKYCLLRS